LGLVLGWLLWKFTDPKQSATAATELLYWKERLEQSRFERNLDQERMTALESERDKLKRRLKSILADKSGS
jgi:hypothetical protein